MSRLKAVWLEAASSMSVNAHLTVACTVAVDGLYAAHSRSIAACSLNASCGTAPVLRAPGLELQHGSTSCGKKRRARAQGVPS